MFAVTHKFRKARPNNYVRAKFQSTTSILAVFIAFTFSSKPTPTRYC
jgi:hypothetical protein